MLFCVLVVKLATSIVQTLLEVNPISQTRYATKLKVKNSCIDIIFHVLFDYEAWIQPEIQCLWILQGSSRKGVT